MAGLSSVRARGRMGGQKKLLSPQQVRVVKTMWDSREHTRHEIGAHFGVSVQTIDRAVRASTMERRVGRGSDTSRSKGDALSLRESRVLALGLCSTSYTLKRQDEEYFGGLRKAVLERDGYHCRVCNASGCDKRSIIVHPRIPGRSVLNLMLSLCPGCHAKIHRTKAVLWAMPPLLLELWREQHPKGHEQKQLDFSSKKPAAKLVPLFRDEKE